MAARWRRCKAGIASYCPAGSITPLDSTGAHVAVLHTRGEIALNDPRRFEGLLGTCFRGEARRAEESNGLLYVSPRITGRAYLTGFHRFVVEADDPLPAGYRLGRGS